MTSRSENNEPIMLALEHDNYSSLAVVLDEAYHQAAYGKGKARHADERPFEEQSTQQICRLLNSNIGMLHQAMKKIIESQRLDRDHAIAELLGAIVYVAGAIIYMRNHKAEAGPAFDPQHQGDQQ